jgi:hypothetical protein
VSLSGKIDQKYVLVFSWTFKPRRTFQTKEGWPSSPEENLERLKSCGFVSDRGIPKCDNCGQMVCDMSAGTTALEPQYEQLVCNFITERSWHHQLRTALGSLCAPTLTKRRSSMRIAYANTVLSTATVLVAFIWFEMLQLISTYSDA